jgi:hypothetical protein
VALSPHIGVLPHWEPPTSADLAAMALLALGSLCPPYVAIVYFDCFRRFKGMLQLNQMDVAKVDRRMLYMFPIFQLFKRHVVI